VRIGVVGGGPGGLFFSTLLKRADPSHEVTVFERNAPDATFGFGVVFPERSLRYLREADRQTHAALTNVMVNWDALEYRHRGRVLRCGGNVFSGLARMDLLRVLQHQARDAGVGLRFQDTVDGFSAMSGYDIVVAADGLNSLARREMVDDFRPSIHLGRSKYIWLGTTQTFTALTFIFEESEHGWLVAHIYPHSTGASTFIVETDEDTWRRAGLDGATDAAATCAETLDYCTRVFARHLDGHPLLGNNSRWLNFRTVRNARWHAGNIVLIGDAAHTAHFSVGSGTRMALEDAIALARALQRTPTVPDALAAYERERRPAVQRIQRAAEPSRRWFEGFRQWTSFTPEQLAFHHVARTRILTYGTLVVRDEGFVRAAEARFAPSGASAVDAPFRIREVMLSNRIVATRPPFDGAGLILADIGEATPQAGGAPAGVWLRVGINNPPAAAVLVLDDDDADLVAAVRATVSDDRVLGARIEAWADPEDDAANEAGVAAARRLKASGCEVIVITPPSPAGRQTAGSRERAREAHAHASDMIRNLAGVPTIMLGGDYSAGDVNALILAGRTDLCEWPRLAWSGWRPGLPPREPLNPAPNQTPS
jgi:2-polyprenyl-6-methoxyphenol hydroxylase-like FAD-dependent oxidoreductase